ncbi:hypothetical protein LOD99_12234 [Oopsacas minuta]|uniref:Amino acid transporter transmembrane domain-containing protein n=1 Tax=Oopsacas minuta TaxID=111878 RepID=A0AAV7JEM3_9METZ|nr:hypothetical protein LOD99_12234 [Oopsacas minuta]
MNDNSESIFKSKKLKTPAKPQFNVIIGYFYNLNFILGTGFLGIPFTFYNAGILPSLLTLTLLSVTGCITALWMLEILGRARVLNKLRGGTSKENLINDNSDDIVEYNSNIYVISQKRKFEMTELSEIMFGLVGKIIFVIIMIIYSCLTLWSMAAVVGTSWSTNIPINTSVVIECNATDFTKTYFPIETRCFNFYRICVSVFGLVVTLLSLLELNEQKYIQAVFSILRFVALTSIIIFSIFIIIHNISTPHNPLPPTLQNTNSTSVDLLLRFDIKWWLVTIPVLVYAQNLHQGIPSLTHPVMPKRRLKPMLIATFITTWSFYTILGIVVSFAFMSLVNENATLNWDYFTHAANNIGVKIISYFIILFPSLDIISAYPLVVTTLANNVYLVLMRRDTSESILSWKDRIGKLIFRLFFAFIPLLGALFISNLVTVLNFAGLFAFMMLFLLPISCQFQSKRLCKKEIEDFRVDDIQTIFEPLATRPESIGTESHFSEQTVSPAREYSPLRQRSVKKCALKDMLLNIEAKTPYSGWYSSNIVVIIVSLVAGVCFALAVGSVIYTLIGKD